MPQRLFVHKVPKDTAKMKAQLCQLIRQKLHFLQKCICRDFTIREKTIGEQWVNLKKMLEFRWHGRGGQGAWTASELLARTALSEGKYIQSFPEFGYFLRVQQRCSFCVNREPVKYFFVFVWTRFYFSFVLL